METIEVIRAFVEAYIAQQEAYHGSKSAHYPRALEFVGLMGEKAESDPAYAAKLRRWVYAKGPSTTVFLRDELLLPLGADYSHPARTIDFNAFTTLDSAHLHYVRATATEA